MPRYFRTDDKRPIIISILGFLLFSISFIFLLTIDIDSIPIWLIPLAVLWMTFLYTGLFIMVHDSMHGSILPRNRWLNNMIGTVSIFFYAMFSYRKLKKKHFEHHRNPGTDKDPDFHPSGKGNFFFWYFRFMKNYLSPLQLLGMAVVFNILLFVVGLSWKNLILFWVTPSLLSTLQLFYFGTYLPHREKGGFDNKYNARSSNFPFLISLITCFHFGYHLEHHKFPYVPWWRLPWVRKEEKKG